MPDVSVFPTAAFQTFDRSEQDMAFGTAGFGGQFWQPVWAAYSCGITTIDAAWSAYASISQNAALTNAFHGYRPVSMCVKAYLLNNASANEGEIVGCLIPYGQSIAALDDFNTVAKRWSAVRGPLRSGMEYFWIPEGPASREFIGKGSVDGTVADSVINNHFPGIMIMFTGGHSSGTIVFETYTNWEAIPEEQSWNIVGTTLPYVSNKDLEEATGVISELSAFGRPIGEQVGSWMLNMGGSLAQAASDSLLAGAAHYVSTKAHLPGVPGAMASGALRSLSTHLLS